MTPKPPFSDTNNVFWTPRLVIFSDLRTRNQFYRCKLTISINLYRSPYGSAFPLQQSTLLPWGMLSISYGIYETKDNDR